MLPTQLAESAALAATAAPPDPATAVTVAAREGAWAAQRGLPLPLFVLLDVRAALGRVARGGRRSFPDAGSSQPYDRWLTRFCKEAATRCHLAQLTPPEASTPWFGYLPLLDALRRDPAPRLRAWVNAYEVLARNPWPAAARWQEGRAHADWAALWFADPPDFTALAALRSGFVAARPDLDAELDFEHAAAALYLAADDPELTRDQAARIRKLQVVRAEQKRPTVEAFEEQHPFVGTWTLFTLTQGEYGDFALVNDSYPRIATPPRAKEPTTFRIHLGWLTGYDSCRTPVPGAGTAAAVFLGVLALVLDDWRAALKDVRARFVLTREWPRGPGERVEARPGARWKTVAVRDGRRGPPPAIVGHLFRRPDLVELAADRPPWKAQAIGSGPQWWCAALAEPDLGELGFHRDKPSSPWIGNKSVIPRPYRTALIVDPVARTGTVCQVVHELYRTVLRPIAPSHAVRADDSYLDFRRAATNALLDALLDPLWV